MLALVGTGLLLGAPRARAQADDPLDVNSLSAMWASPGRIGWTPDGSLGVPGAWQFAGLVRGGWVFDSPLDRAPTAGPGVREAGAPRAWWDSVAVTVGEGGAWQGWDGAIARTEGFLLRPTPRRARLRATVSNGSSSLDRNAYLFTRGDSRGWIRGAATGDSHEGLGPLGPTGAHQWHANAGWVRGDHTVEALFRQQGAGNHQGVGVGECARGENGQVSWRWSRDARWSAATVRRGWDLRESQDDERGTFLEHSRRDAQRTGLDVEAGQPAAGGRLSARFSADREDVRRRRDVTSFGAFRAHAERWWAAVRWQRPLAGGGLDASLGAGWHSAFRGRDEALQLAPALAWRRAGERGELRLFGERVLTPVWSDLTEDTSPFLQSTWLAGAEGALRAPGVASLRVRALTGATAHAANERRYPIEDIALQVGLVADERTRDFSVFTLAGAASWKAFAAELEGYAAASREPEFEPRYDPELGAAARLETEFPAFQGDLRVRVQGEAAWVGERTSLTTDTFGNPVRTPLDGYPTFNGLVALSVGDAVLRLRGVNLADVRRPDVWEDLGTRQAALGSGRQLIFELSWVFEN